MKTIITQYRKVKNPTTDCNYIKCELYYHLGGQNFFTYKNEGRGYYLSVSPVYRNGYTESYIAFSGKKMLVKEVARQNKKAQAEAEEFFKENIERYIKMICPEYECEEETEL